MNYLKSNIGGRPVILSPSLFVYKPTIESFYSILIRILGCYLFLLVLLLPLSLGDSFLFGEFFYGFKVTVGLEIYFYFVKAFHFILVIIRKITFFPVILFISLIFLLNHSHLGYRHSLIRGNFKGDFAYPFQRMAYTKFKCFEEDVSHNYYQNPYTGELGYSYAKESVIARAIKERILEEDFYFFDDYKPIKDWVDPKGKVFFADGREKEETFAKLGNWKSSIIKLKRRANLLIWFKYFFGIFFSFFSLYLICFIFFINLAV